MSRGIAKADAVEQVLGQLDEDVRPRDVKIRQTRGYLSVMVAWRVGSLLRQQDSFTT
jgi:hypothetical protein